MLITSASSGSAVRAAPLEDTVDRTSGNVLDELTAIPPAPATSRSATATGVESGAASGVPWGRLLRLFAPALATAAAVGIAGGVLGVFVLLRREALTALALPQMVALGAAVGMRLSWPTLPPAMLSVGVAVTYLAWSRGRREFTATWTLPALYVAGLCVSFLIIAHHGQDVADLQNLFTGIDVAVTPAQAWAAVPVLLLAAALGAGLWRRWLLLAQAPAAAELAGLRPARWHLLFLSLVATVVLVGTASLGVVMVLALLFVPAAVVLPWSRRIPTALVGATAVALASVAVGFYLSNLLNWPLSQSVGGVGVGFLMASTLIRKIR